MSDDDEVFDDLARRAGAALRRPAPEDGVSTIVHRRRRQQAFKATVVGAVGLATLIGAVLVVPNRDDADSLRPVDSSPATLPATTEEVVPDTLPATTVDVVPDTLPATTVEAVPDTHAAMWPQSSSDEVRQAQQLADANDRAYTWQVDPRLTSPFRGSDSGLTDHELWTYLRTPGADIVERFLREQLGWEEFLFSGEGIDVDELRGLVYLRCAPGETNPLYPTAWDGDQEAPGGHRCAPTIDELRYEAVTLDLSQPDRQGVHGIWVVSRSATTHFAQADPSVVEDEATARLERWLQARIDGKGAEGYVEAFYLFGGPDDVPLLYATATDAPYERYEIERVVSEASWPYGGMDFVVRLFAEGGATVVEQQIHLTDPQRLSFRYSEDETTVNGEPLPEP